MADDTQQQQAPLNINDALQALIRQQLAAASGQQQVQLPSLPTPQAQTQYSNDPEKGPDLLQRIGLALGGGAMPGAPAELRAQMGSQGLLNFGIGLMSAGKFATPGEVLAGGLRGAQAGLLGNEAALAGQQEYALNTQTKMAELAAQQQKNRTEALTALVPLLQMQGRLGLPPLFGPGSGGPGGGGTSTAGDGSYPTEQQPGWSYLAQLSPEMQKMVQTAAEQTGMPAELLAAHKWNESRGQSSVKPNLQDPGGGSFGIMQMGQGALDDYNAKHNTKYTLQDIHNDPQLALNVGAGHWVDLKERYKGNNFLASMAYARGTGATDAWTQGGSKYADLPPGVQRVLGNIYGPGSFPGATPIPEALALNQRGRPASAPGSATGPYKVPVAPPSASPSSGSGGAASPPPVSGTGPAAPPAPAAGPVVPSLAPTTTTDPETGLPVLTPAGTPAVLRPPPPGQVITPGGQLSPAPTVEQPPAATPSAQPPAAPAQPPAQPAPPPTAVYPGDVQATPEQYMREHYQAATPEEVARYAPGPTGEAARNAAQKVQDAQQQLTATRAQLDQIRRGAMPGDPNKAMSDVQAAQNELDKNRSAYDEEVQKLAQSGASNLLTRDNAERTRVSQDYQKVQDREQQNQQQAATLANNIRLKQLEGQQAQELAAANQGRTVVNKRMEDLQGRADIGQRMLRNVSVLETLATQMGDASQLLAKHPDLRDALLAYNIGTKEQLDKMSASQAWDRAVSSFFQDTRVAGTGSQSDREGEWMMRQFGGAEQTPEDRLTQLAIIRKLAEARIQDHSDAQEIYDANNGLKLTGLNERIRARANLFDRPPAWDASDPGNSAVQGRYVMGHPRGEPYAAYWDTGGGKMELRFTRNEMVQDRQTGKMRLQPVPMLGGSLVVGQ